MKYPSINPQELEPHYSKHVDAMTNEQLHAKSDIAIQLAWRDKRINGLMAENATLQESVRSLFEKVCRHEEITAKTRLLEESEWPS